MTPEQLKEIPLFAILSDAQRERLAAAGSELRVSKGKAFIREGEENPYLFVLREGEVDVLSYGVKVKTLKPQAVIGEISTAGLSRPVATVVAATDCVLWAFPRDVVTEIAFEHEEFGERLRDLAMTRILS
ncbi:MAG: cyclic nucleotide-binding domain-containing protein [Zetaproteobacteria bacterium]|nr:MAG: cyclic nucleotide-binding domain-containing protein [Zetaproteobacteria bacterium]